MLKSGWNLSPQRKESRLWITARVWCAVRSSTHNFSPSATAHKSHWEGSLSYYCQQRDVFTSRLLTRRSCFAGKILESRLQEFSLQHNAAELYPGLEAFSLGLCWLPGSGSVAPRDLAVPQPGTCGVSWDLCWQYCSWFQYVSSSMKSFPGRRRLYPQGG